MEKHRGLIVCDHCIIEDGKTMLREDFLRIMDQKKGNEIEFARTEKDICASLFLGKKILGLGKTEKEAKANLYGKVWDYYRDLKNLAFTIEAILYSEKGGMRENQRNQPKKVRRK